MGIKNLNQPTLTPIAEAGLVYPFIVSLGLAGTSGVEPLTLAPSTQRSTTELRPQNEPEVGIEPTTFCLQNSGSTN